MQAGGIVTFPKKTQALLAYLGLRPGQAYARDHLAALLWGETGDKQAHKSLRQAMYVLNKALPAAKPPILQIKGGTIVLDTTAVEVDVATFECLLAEGTTDALEGAAALFRGDFLEGLNVNEASFEEWLTAERERLRELVLEALDRLLAQQLSAGRTERAIQTAVRLLGLDPLHEVAHRTLMRLYAAHGRRGAALKQYQLCAAVLQRELGAEPEPETKRLHQEILQQRATEPPRLPVPRPRHGRDRHRPIRATSTERKASGPQLVGRESELMRLRASLDAAEQGQGQIAVILGEAGIGKSSLLTAVAAEAHGRGFCNLLGYSFESQQVLAYGPWVEALRYGNLTADLDIFDGLRPVWQEALGHLVPELTGTRPEAAVTPDCLRLFEAVTELVRNLAARKPVFLMLEDVHWADDMSGRLIAFLVRRIRTSRVLVALTMREEELVALPIVSRVLDELGKESHFVKLVLPPLTRGDTTKLALCLASSGSQAELVARMDERIWRASEGNPFIVVETIRALQQGSISHVATAFPLPEPVRREVAGRLERLSDRARYVASVGAVIGREFEFALLQRAAMLDDRAAAECVEELVKRHVLHGVGERFDFTHDWVREVAYAELLQPRRKELHILVAKAFEDLHVGNLEVAERGAMASTNRE